jgi:demethylmenaquinone methyltransferase/2-methoxy-6-polyprenyl-1,4-benzoquinol methylase
MEPATRWVDFEISFIRQRYNRLAKFFVLFEWLFWLPTGIRKKAVQQLELKPGDRVLEIGCGTGRNLALLREAVGADGRIYGVDLSEGMLEKAEVRRARHNWKNVTLVHSDAANFTAPAQVDGVLFSLSYATLPHHREVLRLAWNQLRPGKYLVIMDAKVPPGLLGKLLLPYGVWIMKRTVLGNPYIHPWDELLELTRDFEMREMLWGCYFICRGKKNRDK